MSELIWKEKLYSDVTIRINGRKEMACHKLILSRRSEYFKILFSEKFNNNFDISIPVGDRRIVATYIIENILEFMYVGTINQSMMTLLNSRDNAKLTDKYYYYVASDYLMIEALKTKFYENIKICLDKVSVPNHSLMTIKSTTNYKNYPPRKVYKESVWSCIFPCLKKSETLVEKEKDTTYILDNSKTYGTKDELLVFSNNLLKQGHITYEAFNGLIGVFPEYTNQLIVLLKIDLEKINDYSIECVKDQQSKKLLMAKIYSCLVNNNI